MFCIIFQKDYKAERLFYRFWKLDVVIIVRLYRGIHTPLLLYKSDQVYLFTIPKENESMWFIVLGSLIPNSDPYQGLIDCSIEIHQNKGEE